MDFDIGNFLYILLMIVFVVIGSIGKRKKSQATGGLVQEPETEIRDIPADIFDENLRKFFGQRELEPEVIEENFYENAKAQEKTLIDSPIRSWDNYQGVLDTAGSEEGTSVTYKIEDHIEEITRQSKLNENLYTARKTDFVQKALKDFDPRKAIIYKEVFEPKYF